MLVLCQRFLRIDPTHLRSR